MDHQPWIYVSEINMPKPYITRFKSIHIAFKIKLQQAESIILFVDHQTKGRRIPHHLQFVIP